MATIVRIRDLKPRAPEHGRIRFGEQYEGVNKYGKKFTAMRATDTWRFTSPDRDAIEQLAALYGGTCKPWFNAKANPQHQFEVQTESNKVSVLLPQDCYELTFEQWGGKGKAERRCDGEICTFLGAGQPLQRPCICAEQEEQTCKWYSRMNLIIPDIHLGGLWRLEVKGKNFAYEAPGMIDIVRQHTDGLVRVNLLLTKRTGRDDQGRINHFNVPQLTVAATPDQMLQGMAKATRLAIGPAAEHPSVTHARPQLAAVPDVAEDIVDAEVVEDEWVDWNSDRRQGWAAGQRSGGGTSATSNDDDLTSRLEESLRLVQEKKRKQREQTPVDGWMERPPNVKVRRNPDPNGPTWIRR